MFIEVPHSKKIPMPLKIPGCVPVELFKNSAKVFQEMPY